MCVYIQLNIATCVRRFNSHIKVQICLINLQFCFCHFNLILIPIGKEFAWQMILDLLIELRKGIWKYILYAAIKYLRVSLLKSAKI